MTWGSVCAFASDLYKEYSGRTVSLWLRDFNRGKVKGFYFERFPISMHGKQKFTKVISPFSEKEGEERLYLEFTTWACSDLEPLTIKKSTICVNNTILKDMLPQEMNKLNIKFAVKPDVVLECMKECGLRYAPYKKEL